MNPDKKCDVLIWYLKSSPKKNVKKLNSIMAILEMNVENF